jgi:hypothetical protein
MAEKRPCDICNIPAQYIAPGRWRAIRDCPRCGKFEYDLRAGLPGTLSPGDMVRLSGWVRDQNAAGAIPVQLTRTTWCRVTERRPPGLRERTNRALGVIARAQPDVRKQINLPQTAESLQLQGVTYSQTSDEAMQLIYILIDDGYLGWITPGVSGTLTPKGLLAAEALGASGSGAQGFVAMSFDRSMQEVWINGFDPGIRAAGYAPVRIDNKDYVGGITDEMIAEIRRSCFVVADYTGHRNNVYFEAGFALGLGLTVIQTCRANEATNLHFDIRHLNTLEWKSTDELAEGLNRRIRAVVGVGPDADPS